jgi:hypothetical protein
VPAKKEGRRWLTIDREPKKGAGPNARRSTPDSQKRRRQLGSILQCKDHSKLLVGAARRTYVPLELLVGLLHSYKFRSSTGRNVYRSTTLTEKNSSVPYRLLFRPFHWLPAVPGGTGHLVYLGTGFAYFYVSGTLRWNMHSVCTS